MRYVFLLLCAALAAPVAADDWAALRGPNTHAIMRHALAPGAGDPANFDVSKCETQRNLDARGRAQAERTGAELRAQGITFDRVLSSVWCRSYDTAVLMALGEVERFEPLNSFFRDRGREPTQTAAVKAAMRDAEGPLMMVTHQVNITALTGEWVESGEIFVIRLEDDQVTIIGRILIDP